MLLPFGYHYCPFSTILLKFLIESNIITQNTFNINIIKHSHLFEWGITFCGGQVVERKYLNLNQSRKKYVIISDVKCTVLSKVFEYSIK